MKRAITFFFVSLFTLISGLGQSIDPLGEGFDPTMDYLPPSPSASALTKYVDFPVNYYTGTPQISIPIYELKGRGISVPISLSYHAGGVKVDELEGNAGLGWSLHAGGVINRTVIGKADDQPDGFMERGNQVTYPIDLQNNFDEFKLFADGTWDSQPDQFSFSFGGYSGKFVFEDENTIRLVPHQDLKITYEKCIDCGLSFPYSASIISFKVLTPDGIEYTFGADIDAMEYSEISSVRL